MNHQRRRIIDNTVRFEVWKLYCEGVEMVEIADRLNVSYSYVVEKVNRWKGTERMDRQKEKKLIYYVPDETQEKSIFHKLSEQASEVNPFVLQTTNWRIVEAYKRMLNNKNTDIPL